VGSGKGFAGHCSDGACRRDTPMGVAGAGAVPEPGLSRVLKNAMPSPTRLKARSPITQKCPACETDCPASHDRRPMC